MVGNGFPGVPTVAGMGVVCPTLCRYWSHCAYMKANCPSVNSNIHGSLDRFIKLWMGSTPGGSSLFPVQVSKTSSQPQEAYFCAGVSMIKSPGILERA